MYKMLALNNKRMVIHIGVICQNIYTNENVYILINIKGFFCISGFSNKHRGGISLYKLLILYCIINNFSCEEKMFQL